MDARSSIVADWVAQTRFESLPDDVVAATRLRILDVIGLAIAGGTTQFGKAVRDSATLYPGEQTALWGSRTRASALGAAFVNGALSQALEYDDTHNESIVHISSPSVAAALAVIDWRGGSGRDLITAVAIGNEVSSRAGSVTPGQFHKRGFHPSGLFAPFGVAYLAARLLRCDNRQMTNAAGIVGSFAAGLIQCWVDGTQSKFLHPGWAAQSGIVAATLGREGATGPSEIFEGRFGLFASHLQTSESCPDFERLTRNLGTDWESRKASFKPFPAAHVIHPYVDALLRLRRRHSIAPEQVQRITCPVAPYIVGIVCEPLSEKRRPLTDSHGRVSLQYTLAEAMALGRLDRHSYAEGSLRDPVILGLADKIDYVIDRDLPGPEQFKGIIKVALVDGQSFEEVEEHNRGSPINPMSEEDIIKKFQQNVDGTLSAERAAELQSAVLNVDACEDARMIAKLTAPDA